MHLYRLRYTLSRGYTKTAYVVAVSLIKATVTLVCEYPKADVTHCQQHENYTEVVLVQKDTI